MTAPALVDCPACGGEGRRRVYRYIGRDFMPRDPRIEDCSECEGTGRVTADRAAEMTAAAADAREAAEDDEAHRRRERISEREDGR